MWSIYSETLQSGYNDSRTVYNSVAVRVVVAAKMWGGVLRSSKEFQKVYNIIHVVSFSSFYFSIRQN